MGKFLYSAQNIKNRWMNTHTQLIADELWKTQCKNIGMKKSYLEIIVQVTSIWLLQCTTTISDFAVCNRAISNCMSNCSCGPAHGHSSVIFKVWCIYMIFQHFDHLPRPINMKFRFVIITVFRFLRHLQWPFERCQYYVNHM